MKPSTALQAHRHAIGPLVSRFRCVHPRVFGSVVRGEDSDASDLDVLVDALPETTLFDLGGLQVALETLLGVPVDVLTPQDLPERFRAQVLAQAVAV